MKTASQLFSPEDRERIAAAVRKAEEQTSAEIVPAVATSSGRYDRAEDLFGVLFALVVVALGWKFVPHFRPEGESLLGIVPLLLAFLFGFILGALLASRIPELRLPFLFKREMDEEAERSAQALFMSAKLRKTRAGTGVLIYVSLFEHRVIVLPDDSISDKLPTSEWNVPCQSVVDGMKSGQPVAALEKAIEECGRLLAQPFPREKDDVDELSNQLLLID